MRVRAIILEGEADAATIAMIREAMTSDDLICVFAPVRVADVIARVAFESGVAAREIKGEARDARVFRARAAVTWIARQHGRSYSQIARCMGERDHSTAVHQFRRATALRARDPAFRHLTDRIMAEFAERGL